MQVIEVELHTGDLLLLKDYGTPSNSTSIFTPARRTPYLIYVTISPEREDMFARESEGDWSGNGDQYHVIVDNDPEGEVRTMGVEKHQGRRCLSPIPFPIPFDRPLFPVYTAPDCVV